MPGLFGTNAPLAVDINLLLQVVAIVILLVAYGYKRMKNYKVHGSLMGTAVVLHAILFLLVMGPQFVKYYDFLTTATSQLGVQISWVHAVMGSISLILGIVLIGAWLRRPSDISGCFRRKRIMDVTFPLWILSAIFGIAAYLVTYL